MNPGPIGGIAITLTTVFIIVWLTQAVPKWGTPTKAPEIAMCLEPQHDITAFEVATFLKYAIAHKDGILIDHPELARHTLAC